MLEGGTVHTDSLLLATAFGTKQIVKFFPSKFQNYSEITLIERRLLQHGILASFSSGFSVHVLVTYFVPCPAYKQLAQASPSNW